MKNDEIFDQNKPVFLDTKGRRKHYLSYLSIAGATVVTVLLTFFVISVLINPFLPQIKLKPVAVLPQQPDINIHPPERPALTRAEKIARQTGDKAKQEQKKRDDARLARAGAAELLRAEKDGATARTTNDGNPLAVGFFVNWDDSSIASLRQNINNLDWIVPEWIRLSGDEQDPLVLDIDEKALDFIQRTKPEMPVLPLLQNYKNEQWNTDILLQSVSTEDQRRKLITSLLQTIDKNKFGGVTIDVEEMPPSGQTDLFKVIRE